MHVNTVIIICVHTHTRTTCEYLATHKNLTPCVLCLCVCVLQSVMQGTIPYLGTFLTDLVMMDTAMKDYLDVSVGALSHSLCSCISKCFSAKCFKAMFHVFLTCCDKS